MFHIETAQRFVECKLKDDPQTPYHQSRDASILSTVPERKENDSGLVIQFNGSLSGEHNYILCRVSGAAN